MAVAVVALAAPLDDRLAAVDALDAAARVLDIEGEADADPVGEVDLVEAQLQAGRREVDDFAGFDAAVDDDESSRSGRQNVALRAALQAREQAVGVQRFAQDRAV